MNTFSIKSVDVAEFRIDREYYAGKTIILTGGVLNSANSLAVNYDGKKGGTYMHIANFIHRDQKLTTLRKCSENYSLSRNIGYIPDSCLVDIKVRVDYLKEYSSKRYKDIRLRNVELLYKDVY